MAVGKQFMRFTNIRNDSSLYKPIEYATPAT